MSAFTDKPESFFPVEAEYARCINVLNCTGILTLLPKSKRTGVIGIDGKEYPVPTREQLAEIFLNNRALVDSKVAQGFALLELIPLAMPSSVLIECMKGAILKHAAEGTIFQTRRSPAGPLIPVRVNKEKQLWIWGILGQALDTDKMVYFPQEYCANHRGQYKLEVIHNERICAVPGWSVGLTENVAIMPGQSQAKTLSGRKQLEIGSSPNEYLQILKSQPYREESGKTLEDFIIDFLARLETTGEVSNDVNDNNALWCLGQYLKLPYADVVPTGRWVRDVGRARLDMHRTNNKQCTKSWGASTTVRLPRP